MQVVIIHLAILMKTLRILAFSLLMILQFTSCISSKDLPGPEVEEVPTGDMGGGTGSGTIGDDPKNP